MPDDIADRIRTARAAYDELHDAVLDALRAGGSVREVAEISGLSTNTVQRWKREL